MAEARHNRVAIDLGASNGRVILGRGSGGRCSLEVVHRFEHGPVPRDGKVCWDWELITGEIRTGLDRAAEACAGQAVTSVSCSGWAQDFGLIDGAGRLFYPPVSYRDSRTAGMPESFADVISPDELVRRVGCGVTPVTALCQLRVMAVQEPEVLRRAGRLLFVADLIHHELCGSATTDWTLATASQLRNLRTGRWDVDLLDRLGIPGHFLPAVTAGPRVLGRIPAGRDVHPALAGAAVVSAAGHDTAAAAAAIPVDRGQFFLSLGTWAMLGCCTGDLLVPAGAARDGWFVLGVGGGKWGVFRAGAGLWLLQECRRLWRERGRDLSHEGWAEEARRASIRSTIDPSDPRFHAPRDMLLEIAGACREAGAAVPATPGEFARVVLDSLAAHYAGALARLGRAVGLVPNHLYILGGGIRNTFLCDRIAEAAGVPVAAGPAEATAAGNLALQAAALGLNGNTTREI